MTVALLAMAATSCYEESFVQYNPEATVAPVLGDLSAESFVLAEEKNEEAFATFNFTEADFGINTAIRYTLYADLKGNDFASQKKLAQAATPIETAAFTLKVKDVNTTVLNLIKAATEEDAEINPVADVEFRLAAEWMGESAPVGPVLYSNVLSANVTVYVPEVAEGEDEKLSLSKVWVIGSYCGWAHGSSLFLYNFEGDDVKYNGVVDFGEDTSANEFKITYDANWDAANDFGSDDSVTDAEPAEVLFKQQGSNVKNYTANRYYHFTYSKADTKLTKNASFNEVGIIGLAGDWEAGVSMTYHAASQRFYADVEVAEATTFKFWFDKDWALNFGGDPDAMTVNGGDMSIEAGNYRIYLEMNNFSAPKAIVSASMYGKEEGSTTTPEPEPEPEDPNLPEGARPVVVLCESTGWDVTNLYGWGGKLAFTWPGDAALGSVVLSGVEYSYWTLAAANWQATEVGLIFNNGSVQTVDIAPVTLDGDKCFKVTEAGADGKLGYEELALPVIRITYKNEAGWDAVSIYGWGDLGDFGGWPGQAMTKVGDVWVYDIPVEHLGKSTNLIFNNAGAGAQTVDLGPFVLDKDYVFDNSNAAIK